MTKDIVLFVLFVFGDSLKHSVHIVHIALEKEIPLILRLLYCCGLRAGEIVNIKVGDADIYAANIDLNN